MITKEQARENLEDAICRALEAGMTEREVQEEVEFTLNNFEEDIS